jgi:hypothetical protein
VDTGNQLFMLHKIRRLTPVSPRKLAIAAVTVTRRGRAARFIFALLMLVETKLA